MKPALFDEQKIADLKLLWVCMFYLLLICLSVSLCRSAQVCKVWRQIAEDQSLWRRFCCQTKWRLSKAAEHKQVISHMSPEGSIQVGYHWQTG